MSAPIRVMGTRLLIAPDREDLSPIQTDSGVFLARTIGAALTGHDEHESWYSGTVLAVGKGLTGLFDVRAFVLRRVRAMVEHGGGDLGQLVREIEALPLNVSCDVHEGDRVTFSATAGHAIELDGAPYLILDIAEVLGVLTPEDLHG